MTKKFQNLKEKLKNQLKKSLEKRNKYLYNTYGITINEYILKLAEQKNVCAICNTEAKAVFLSVDHRHVKGFKKMKPEDKKIYVRGLLCYRCNKFLIGMIDRYMNGRFVLEQLTRYFDKYGYNHE